MPRSWLEHPPAAGVAGQPARLGPGHRRPDAIAVSQDPDTALRVHTREELSVDQRELPSPIVAGVASLIAGGMVVRRLTGRPLGVRLFAPHVVISEARSGTGSALG